VPLKAAFDAVCVVCFLGNYVKSAKEIVMIWVKQGNKTADFCNEALNKQLFEGH